MNPITTIEQLIESFENSEPDEHSSILHSINISTEDFAQHASWKKQNYTRNCLTKKEGFELILLCWDANTVTKVHDHNGQNCWVYQIKGRMIEERFSYESGDLDLIKTIELDEGGISYMHDSMGFHRLINPENTRAMTLHIYANPIEQCKIFEEEQNTFNTVALAYDTIASI